MNDLQSWIRRSGISWCLLTLLALRLTTAAQILPPAELGNATGLPFLEKGSGGGIRSRSTKEFLPGCENGTLKACQDLIPPRSDDIMGIPSTPKAVDNACLTFNRGIECYSNWAKRCLKDSQVERMNMSILGAHEIYTFLCRDPQFKKDFLAHAACYRKISPRWDECANRFIAALRTFTKHERASEDICCLRHAFIECVMQATKRNCEAAAARFIQPLAETLLRSRLQGNSPTQCVAIKPQHCPGSASNANTSKMSYIHSLLGLLVVFFVYAQVQTS